MERTREEAKSGQNNQTASILKFYGSELNKRRTSLKMDIYGANALGWKGTEFDEGKIARSWLRSKANSIEGGTSEIQLNIISKRILNLPQS
jgi:acyl-CoA dehydrogenase